MSVVQSVDEKIIPSIKCTKNPSISFFFFFLLTVIIVYCKGNTETNFPLLAWSKEESFTTTLLAWAHKSFCHPLLVTKDGGPFQLDMSERNSSQRHYLPMYWKRKEKKVVRLRKRPQRRRKTANIPLNWEECMQNWHIVNYTWYISTECRITSFLWQWT